MSSTLTRESLASALQTGVRHRVSFVLGDEAQLCLYEDHMVFSKAEPPDYFFTLYYNGSSSRFVVPNQKQQEAILDLVFSSDLERERAYPLIKPEEIAVFFVKKIGAPDLEVLQRITEKLGWTWSKIHCKGFCGVNGKLDFDEGVEIDFFMERKTSDTTTAKLYCYVFDRYKKNINTLFVGLDGVILTPDQAANYIITGKV